jgi:hypothetical protein
MPPPRARIAAIALAALGIAAWATVGRPQSQVPGVASPGAAPVRVVNEPSTHAVQSGAWQVSLAPGTAVGLAGDNVFTEAPPDFLRPGHRYLVHPDGERTAVYTFDRLDHGWVRALDDSGARWFNLAQLVSVQDAQ